MCQVFYCICQNLIIFIHWHWSIRNNVLLSFWNWTFETLLCQKFIARVACLRNKIWCKRTISNASAKQFIMNDPKDFFLMTFSHPCLFLLTGASTISHLFPPWQQDLKPDLIVDFSKEKEENFLPFLQIRWFKFS